jgi:hypothetical protein
MVGHAVADGALSDGDAADRLTRDEAAQSVCCLTVAALTSLWRIDSAQSNPNAARLNECALRFAIDHFGSRPQGTRAQSFSCAT